MSPLLRLHRILELFQVRNEDVPVQRIEAFLLVAMRQRATRQEIADALNLSLSAAKRNLEALSTYRYKINLKTFDGLGLLREEPDPADTRRLVYSLTNKGASVADQIRAMMTGGIE